MKAKNNAALRAILATGTFGKVELWTFALVGGPTLRFTTGQVSTVYNGQTYRTGLIITRSSIKQVVGFEVGAVTLTIAPQIDDKDGAPTIGGAAFLSAARARSLELARATLTKVFYPASYVNGAFTVDWRPSAAQGTDWYVGSVSRVDTGRFQCTIEVHDDIENLNTPMPRNVVQTTCLHTLFDTGCTLSEAAFRKTGVVTNDIPVTVGTFATDLGSQGFPDGHFKLGRLTFTTGPNAGLTRVVKSMVHTPGTVVLVKPFPSQPSPGEFFTITPGCLKTKAACENTNAALGPTFNNLAHFRGMPYVPVPETLYDGTSVATVPVSTPGNQGEMRPISGFTGAISGGTYQP